jgi:three-Cys-motif partner protein
MVDRTWGYWTEHKLQMLAAYLPEFTRASKRARATVYLDLFAGDTSNLSRSTGQVITGSPVVALETSPPFSKVVLIELPSQAARLEGELRERFPDRDLTVWAGDCNDTIDAALAALAPVRWAPTFAMVDQYAAEIRWSTLDKLAAFKRGVRTKAELWLLFAHSMLPRGLAATEPDAVARFERRVDEMYGCDDWREMYAARKAGMLDGTELREQLLNLMRWRLENVLGYRATHHFEMKNHGGVAIYSMVFATDHDAGERIMRHIYGKAAEAQPKMRAEAVAQLAAIKEATSATPGLFAPLPRVPKADRLYEHQPPSRPFGERLCAQCAASVSER